MKFKDTGPALGHTAFYFIEKIHDFINGAGTGVIAAPAAASSLMQMLERWEHMGGTAGHNPVNLPSQ